MNDEIRLTTCAIDLGTRTVRRPDAEVRLTALEAALLRSLAERPGEDVARQVLLDRVWGGRGSARTVDFAIRRLRRKLGDPPDLSTSHGVGYRLVPAPGPPGRRGRPIDVATGAIDLDRRVFVPASGGPEARLGRLGCALLDALRSGEPRTREDLACAVWGAGDHADALATTVARLRTALEPPTSGGRAAEVLQSVGGGRLRLAVDEVVRTNLGPARPFVPRSELDAGRAAVLDARVVCLVGPGGAGKTRLARRIARTLVEEGAAPAARLCAVGRDGGIERVIRAVAAGLGLPSAVDPAAAVARTLAALPRHALVLLDNLDPSPALDDLLSRWLADAPGARFLTTSRCALGLDRPDVRRIDVGALPLGSAVALYEAIAGPHQPTDAVHALVRRLDGAPLAIELAAARADVLPAAVLVERWTDRLDRIATASRDGAAVADVLDVLLADPERELLARLALFEAPFPIERGCAVAGVEPERIEALAAGALLHPVDDGQALRFGMHEAIRAYAQRSVGAWPDPDARARWVSLHLALARQHAAPSDAGFDALVALAPELRGMWALDLPDAERGEVGWALGTACEVEGWLDEAERVYRAAIPFAPAHRAWQMIAGRGRRAMLRGEDELALRFALDALEVAQTVDAATGAAARVQVANAERRLRRLDDAVGTIERALAVYRRLERPDDVAMCLSMLASIHVETERFAASFAAYRESHRIARTPGWLAPMSLVVASALVGLGELDQAEAAIAAVAELRTPFQNVHALKVRCLRASIRILRGDRAGADAELAELARGFTAIGQTAWAEACVGSRAGLALREGRPADARSLLDAPVDGWRVGDPRAAQRGWIAAYEGAPAVGLAALDAIAADSPIHRPTFDVSLLGLRAVLEAQRGRLDRAAPLAEQARELCARIEPPIDGAGAAPWVVFTALVDGLVARACGRPDEGARALAWARRQRTADGYRHVEIGLGAWVVAGLLSGRVAGRR